MGICLLRCSCCSSEALCAVVTQGILKDAMPTRPLSTRDLDEVLAHAGAAFAALRNARIFITGGTGFFGHWLLETLLHANRELDLQVEATVLTRNADRFRTGSPHIANSRIVKLLQGDIRNFRFPDTPHTHIVHAATDAGGGQHTQKPYALAESIIDGTRRVLHFAQHTGAKRMLYTSSGAVYGRSTTLPQTPETYLGASDPLLLQSSYDEGKRMAEHLCVAYSQGTALECAVARCFAFVGPHLPLDQHFAIGNFIGAAIADRPITINGDGTPRRSWLYMSDLAAWLWTLLAAGSPHRAYNVGSAEAYSIAEAARLTANTLRPHPTDREASTLPVGIGGKSRPDAPLNSYVPSIDRANKELGLRVTVPLSEALVRTAEWHGYLVPR